MWKVMLVLISGIVILTACSSNTGCFDEYADACRPPDCDDCSWSCGTALHRMELAVVSVMADPDIPVRDLTTDPRIISITQCGTFPMINDCTRDANALILDRPDSGLLPLREYLACGEYNTFEYWYCVHPDGGVECFLEDGSNVRGL